MWTNSTINKQDTMLFQTNTSPNYIFRYEIKKSKMHTYSKYITELIL